MRNRSRDTACQLSVLLALPQCNVAWIGSNSVNRGKVWPFLAARTIPCSTSYIVRMNDLHIRLHFKAESMLHVVFEVEDDGGGGDG